MDFLKAGAGAQIPAPATREQASDTLSEIRDRKDRRRVKKTGRTEYFGVRVRNCKGSRSASPCCGSDFRIGGWDT